MRMFYPHNGNCFFCLAVVVSVWQLFVVKGVTAGVRQAIAERLCQVVYT